MCLASPALAFFRSCFRLYRFFAYEGFLYPFNPSPFLGIPPKGGFAEIALMSMRMYGEF